MSSIFMKNWPPGITPGAGFMYYDRSQQQQLLLS